MYNWKKRKLFSLWSLLNKNIRKNWLRDHTSWASCEIGMKIKGLLKPCFWISRHQATLSLLYFRIQGYMLSLINKVNSCVAFTTCFIWDAKLCFSNNFVMHLYAIPILYWLSKLYQLIQWKMLKNQHFSHVKSNELYLL